MIEQLVIHSPKRSVRVQTGWEGFFPYYAGFPEKFAAALLESASLPPDATVLDPWNGSGTTTYAANRLGLSSRGSDINPVMVIVARARMLAPTEADSIEPLAIRLLKDSADHETEPDKDDPLLLWFKPSTAANVRSIEASMRRHLLGGMTLTAQGTKLECISGIAATFYVALFSVCRHLVAEFQTTNPTWLKRPKVDKDRIATTKPTLDKRILNCLRGMADTLAANRTLFAASDQRPADISVADTTEVSIDPESVDFILTSPPYCTRIDYTAATRIELAVLHPILERDAQSLRRQMIGSPLAPLHEVELSAEWGETCTEFLDKLYNHKSKASRGYYFTTHLDYFDKMNRSLSLLSSALKTGGVAVFVVQDSYYKDVYNDLPAIISEMGEGKGLTVDRCEHFQHRSMSDSNPRTKVYERASGAIETVICFRKN